MTIKKVTRFETKLITDFQSLIDSFKYNNPNFQIKSLTLEFDEETGVGIELNVAERNSVTADTTTQAKNQQVT